MMGAFLRARNTLAGRLIIGPASAYCELAVSEYRRVCAGASEDILNDGFRRMLINASLWCMSMEDAIKPDGPIDFVGPYNPVTYKFGGHRKGVKPADLAGWDSPLLGPKE